MNPKRIRFDNISLIKTALVILSCLVVAACNNQEINNNPDNPLPAVAPRITEADSLKILFDSLMQVKVEIPQVIDKRWWIQPVTGSFWSSLKKPAAILK